MQMNLYLSYFGDKIYSATIGLKLLALYIELGSVCFPGHFGASY